MALQLLNSFKWQYMAVAGAGAGARAEIMNKAGAEAENKSFRLRNTAFLL